MTVLTMLYINAKLLLRNIDWIQTVWDALETFHFSKDILEITKDMVMYVAQSMAKTGVVLKGALRLEKENRRSAKWYAIKNQQSVV